MAKLFGKKGKEEAKPAPTPTTATPLEPRGPDGKPLPPPKEQGKGLVHSSQLDERMRTGDPEATSLDKGRKVLLDLLIVLSLGIILALLLGRVGIGVQFSVAGETGTLALAVGILIGCSFLFNTIRWRALRGPQGAKVLDRARSEIWLTAVSILALFTVVAMGIIEVLALLVFIGVIPSTTDAAVVFAENFVLLQAVMLLVYLLALVARETNQSTYQPSPRALVASRVLTPLAGFTVLVGVILATGVVQLGTIQVHQAVYIVTLGVLFEFLAMRIRLRLPSLYSHFNRAMETARRASPEMREDLRKRAIRTYVIAIVFVAVSMGLAGLVATGTIQVERGGGTTGLLVFYGGAFAVVIGLVVVRYLQHRHLRAPKVADDELARLVQQKRRGPEEILRISVYMATGLIAAVFVALTVFSGLGKLPWHTKYATDFFILACMFGAGPFGYFYNREAKRIMAIDEKFPDFLRDLAESARAGMTLPRALVTAAQGTYGALTPDIRTMAAQVDWGVEFGEALSRFASRTKTPLIDRTVSLIVEAQRAGGSMVDILTAASEDAREIKQIVSERNTQMGMYNVVIYIAFFVFLVVIMVLSAQFIPAFKEAVGAASGQQVGGLAFRDFDPEEFNTAFFHAALAQAIGGGLVGGVLTRGQPVAGFMNIAIMMAVAWFSFRILVGVMG